MQRIIDRRQMVNALLTGTAGVCAVGLGACSGSTTLGPTGALPAANTSSPAPADSTAAIVKVGLMLPLGSSTQIAAIAKSMRQAAELALFERPNANLQLITKDDKGTPEGAKAAADELLKSGAEIVIGPLFAKSVSAIGPMAQAANVPVIGFSNDPGVAGPGVYLLSFLAESEADRIIQHAADQGRRTFAALVSDDASGRIAEQAFRSAIERRGGRVALVERYNIDQSGILEPSRKLKEAFQEGAESEGQIDALYLPGGPDVLPQLSFLIGKAGIDHRNVKLLGSSGWDYAAIGREPRLQGAWFAAPDPRGWRDFSTKFTKSYNAMPARLASLSFDAMDMVSSLASQPRGQRFTTANLTRASGYLGVDGPFRLLPNGRNERRLAVLEVQKDGPIVIEPAPSTLASAGPVAADDGPRHAASLN